MRQDFCPRCGSAIDPKTNRCPDCSQRSSQGIWIALAVILVLAAAGLWLWNTTPALSDSLTSLKDQVVAFFAPEPEPEVPQRVQEALDSAASLAEEAVGEYMLTSDEAEAALKAAEEYLENSFSSPESLRSCLADDGYGEEACDYAVANCGADWKEQAVYAAQDLVSYYYLSYAQLVLDLEQSGFTSEDAAYGADHCGADWMEEATLTAMYFLSEYPDEDTDAIIQRLLEMGYTEEEAQYGAKMAFEASNS